MEKKSKELHYKRAKLKHGAAGTLQSAIEALLKLIPLPADRMEVLGVNADERRVFIHERHHESVLCVTMTTHEKDARQPIMGMVNNSANWPIKQCEPPKIPDVDETTFLEGTLFLGVWRDHVIFLPSRSCGSESLEDYLNYLLRKLPNWPDGALVELDDVPPQEMRDKHFKRVQAFKLDTTLGSRTAPPDPKPPVAKNGKQSTTTAVVTKRFSHDATPWSALKQLIEMFGGKLPEDRLIDTSFDPDDVTVKVEVRCSKRKLEKAGPVMDVMANSLRHVTSNLVKFEFEDGSELKGADLKTRKSIRLDWVGSLPIPNQVDKAIFLYLQELIQKGTVSKDE